MSLNETNTVLSHRVAQLGDLPQIVEIYNATIASRMVTADTEPVSVESRLEWFEQHQPGVRPLWVVDRGPQIAGWLSLSTFYGRPAYNRTAEVSVYVRDGFRRAGIASYLLSQAIAHMPKLELRTLIGFIYRHNQPSLSLFQRFGFSQWGELPRVAVLDGIERDVIIVGLRV